jgi:hypothetical protein
LPKKVVQSDVEAFCVIRPVEKKEMVFDATVVERSAARALTGRFTGKCPTALSTCTCIVACQSGRAGEVPRSIPRLCENVVRSYSWQRGYKWLAGVAHFQVEDKLEG